MKLLTNSVAASGGFLFGSQLSLRIGFHRNPYPMPHQFAALLDHPMRMRYRNPGETLGMFGFASGMTVLDLGCGSGTFTEEMARMVGAGGTVNAVDIQQPMLDLAQERIQSAGYADRVNFYRSGAYTLPFPDESIDLAVLIAVLPQIPDRARALLEVRRVLKPGARLAISEEIPDPAYVPARKVRRWLADAGFRFGGKTSSSLCYHMIFYK